MSQKKKKFTQTQPEAEQLPDFPLLGNQFVTTVMPSIPNDPASNGWIRIAPTFGQRLKRTLITFSEAFIFATIVVCFLYIPDYIADYSHRSEKFVNFFFGFILSSVVIIGLFSALLTFIRDSVCYIHPQSHRIICGSKLFNSQTIAQSLDIKDIPVLQILPPMGITKRAKILAVRDEVEFTIAESIGDDKDLKDIYEWISNFR